MHNGLPRAARLLAFLALATTVPVTPRVAPAQTAQSARTPSLPQRLSDSEFWSLVSEISEPGGFFRITDNYTSNEREIGRLFTMLRERGTSGGVYMGVGPEQNFTYIAAIRPAMAFVIDIRRQAVMQHLMFKAIFEMSGDRADFISMLFSKPKPAGIDRGETIQRIWDAYWNVESDSALAAKNYARIVEQLTKRHRFTFTKDEADQLKSVYEAFYLYGPRITTRGDQTGWGGRNSPTFADLTAWVADANGKPQSFLTTEENYEYVKQLHERNLIVPVSGDFAGPKAIRAIGTYLKQRGGVISAFYVSNVEQYLFQDEKQNAFFDNVATLPVTENSVFIRPYALRRAIVGDALCPIGANVAAAQAGRVPTNNDALACAR
jgi:hypothetical protein